MRRKWSEQEDKLLRKIYSTSTATEIGKMLGRNCKSVYYRAFRLGLMQPQNFIPDNRLIELIIKWHPEGWSDNEIAELAEETEGIGVDRHRVGKLRTRLGLQSNVYSERRRGKVRERTQHQLRQCGLKSLAMIRLQKWNQWKRSLGWPETLTIRAVQAAECFWQLRGVPLTRQKLCDLMGVSSKKRSAPESNAKGGSVLAELVNAGIVIRIPKGMPVVGQGKGRNQDLYILKEGVEPNGSRIETERGEEV